MDHDIDDQKYAAASAAPSPLIGGRAVVASALVLEREFGDDGIHAAALRAAQSRQRGNVATYCHWREVERLLLWNSASQGMNAPTLH